MKNNENNREKNKIIGPAGSRTSTRQRLARGLRPLQGRFSANARGKTSSRTSTRPPEVLQRGTTTGKYNGETKRETKWKNTKWKNVKSHIYIF